MLSCPSRTSASRLSSALRATRDSRPALSLVPSSEVSGTIVGLVVEFMTL
jgi:hypothetical protein